ncbi:PspC domain-containing protein [Corynebacterium comes]|uniref:PspC domain protein n=1 Tax=Corynebacterium comes TaxID=2675218 RepID=A0A6B8VGA6_9CORY|nr:PspC domain-containing protein [Corynebacterium comes]QGU04322.1 PspC domain protein [Corynebacterium comes]
MTDFNTPMHQRRLHRSLTDRYVAGVLGGIAETYGWNSTLVRVLFVASFLLPGPQVLAYFIAWIIMPNG